MATATPRERSVFPRKAVLLGLPVQHSRVILVGAFLLGLAGLILLPQVRFDYNPLNLRDPNSESVSTYADLLEQSKISPWSITVISPNEEAAEGYKVRLNSVDQVKASITLQNFIPPHQEEKLNIIEEIRLILGPHLFEARAHPRPENEHQIAALHDLMAELARFLRTKQQSPLTVSAERLYRNLERFADDLQAANQPSEMLTALESSLLGSLPASLHRLQISLVAGQVSMSDLPEDLVARWASPDGHYRIKVLPRENVNDSEALNRFVAAVRSVVPNATGTAVLSVEAGRAIVGAFKQAFLSALIAISILLITLLRPKSDTLLVLLPLLLAGLLTAATMAAI